VRDKEKSTSRTKNKALEIAKGITICLLAFIVGIYIKTIIKGYTSRLNTFKKDIVNNYSRPEVLDTIFKNNLGDDYTGDINTDFDIFVINNLFNEINKYELEHNKIYNSHLPKEWLESYNTSSKGSASELYGEPINANTYYLKIPQFCDGITYKHFKNYKDDMIDYNNLIIDLRNNTGGNFGDFEKISAVFLKEGSEIYRLYTPKDIIIKKSSNKTPSKFENIIILTNYYTASVSELFLLSLKNNLDNVTIIGTNTHGKNISCNIRTFNDKSGVIFITSFMTGPNSFEIGSQGIPPDIYIGNTEEFYKSLNNPDKEKELRDKDSANQYEQAIQFLANKK